MKLNWGDRPVTVKAAGLHTLSISWGTLTWTASNAEAEQLAADITRLLKDNS